MIFSKRCEYAIRALNCLSQSGRVCHTREISRRQKVPYHFMAKILQALSRKGFVLSVKGAGGGFVLAKPAHKVRLFDVFSAMDGNETFSRCLYGLNECSENMPCPMHQNWKILRGGIETYLRSHTIADLGHQEGPKQLTVRARRARHNDKISAAT